MSVATQAWCECECTDSDASISESNVLEYSWEEKSQTKLSAVERYMFYDLWLFQHKFRLLWKESYSVQDVGKDTCLL